MKFFKAFFLKLKRPIPWRWLAGAAILGVAIGGAGLAQVLGSEASSEALPASEEDYDWHRSFEGSEVYEGQVLVTIPWGELSDEIPLLKGTKKVKFEFGVEDVALSGGHLAVDDLGHLYVFYSLFDGTDETDPSDIRVKRKRGVVIFSSQGKRLVHRKNLHQHNIESPARRRRVVAKGGRGVVLGVKHAKDQALQIGPDGKVKKLHGVNPKALRKPRGEKVWIAVLPGEKSPPSGLFSSGRKQPLAVIPLRYKSGMLFDKRILGQDRWGNVFFTARVHRSAFEHDEMSALFLIRKYAPDGKLLTGFFSRLDGQDIRYPYPDWVLHVDASGNVYQFWHSEEGIHVLKWSQVRRRPQVHRYPNPYPSRSKLTEGSTRPSLKGRTKTPKGLCCKEIIFYRRNKPADILAYRFSRGWRHDN